MMRLSWLRGAPASWSVMYSLSRARCWRIGELRRQALGLLDQPARHRRTRRSRPAALAASPPARRSRSTGAERSSAARPARGTPGALRAARRRAPRRRRRARTRGLTPARRRRSALARPRRPPRDPPGGAAWSAPPAWRARARRCPLPCSAAAAPLSALRVERAAVRVTASCPGSSHGCARPALRITFLRPSVPRAAP